MPRPEMSLPTTREFLLLHGLLAGIVQDHIGRPLALPAAIEAALRDGGAEEPMGADHQSWLALLDLCITPQLLRTGIQGRQPEEESLLALLGYLAAKPVRNDADRDRLELLMTHIFKKRQAHLAAEFGAIQQRVEAALGGAAVELSEPAENLLAELASVLEKIGTVQTFQQLTSSGLMSRGREIKRNFKDEFFHPRVLTSIAHYNLKFGEKFDQLFGEAASQEREFAGRLAKREYRPAAEEPRKPAAPVEALPKAAGAPAETRAAAAKAPPAPPPAETPLQQMRALGIDPTREASKLRLLIGNISAFVRAAGDKGVSKIPLPHTSIPVKEWEVRALGAEFVDSDRSFRAEFNRRLCQSVGFIASLSEELTLYNERRKTEYLWKPHYDALVWVLFEGREHLGALKRFAEETRTRGLQAKADQLSGTGARLEENLNKVAELFTDASTGVAPSVR